MKISDPLNMPKFLHEVHGEKASILDLIFTYLASLLGTALVLFVSNYLMLSFFRIIVLALLSLDLAGGVVANFTSGTSLYYETSEKRRKTFILLHIVQPAIMILLFPDEFQGILVVSFFTLLSTWVVNSIPNIATQRLTGAFLMFTGLILNYLLMDAMPVLMVLFSYYVIKLILAFAVKWENHPQ